MTNPDRLTDDEQEQVRQMAYAGSYSREKADRYVATVESILATRTAALREQVERLAAEQDEAIRQRNEWASRMVEFVNTERERNALRAQVEAVDAMRARWETALGLNSCPSCAFVPETDCDHGEGYHHALSDLRAALASDAEPSGDDR